MTMRPHRIIASVFALTLLSVQATAQQDLAKPDLVIQRGQENKIVSAAFSSREDVMLTGSGDGTAILWEMDSGREIRRFTTPLRSVWLPLAISDDSRFGLITHADASSRQYFVQKVDLGTGIEIQRYQLPSWTQSITFTPNGKEVVGGDSVICRWDAASGKLEHAIYGKRRAFTRTIYSRDGHWALAVQEPWPGESKDGVVQLWDVSTGIFIRNLTGIDNFTQGAISQKTMKAVLWNGQAIHLYDLDTGKETRSWTASPDGVLSVDISSDGRYALTGGPFDKRAHLWETETGKELRQFGTRVNKPGDGPGVSFVRFSPDNRLALVSLSDEYKAIIYDLNSGATNRVLTGHTMVDNYFAISSNYVASTGSSSNIGDFWIWDLRRGRARTLSGHTGHPECAAISQDEKLVVTGGMDRTVRLWNLRTGQQIHQFKGHSNWVSAVAISPDQSFLLSGAMDGSFRRWSTNQGNECRIIKPSIVSKFPGPLGGWDWAEAIKSIAISQNANLALTAGWNHLVSLWDCGMGKTVRTFAHANQAWSINTVAFSPDGQRVLSGGNDSTARVFDIHSGNQLQLLQHSGEVECAAYSPDGDEIITGSIDGFINVWNPRKTNPPIVLQHLDASVFSVGCTLDGRFWMASSPDGCIRVFNRTNYTLQATMATFDDGNWVVVDKDGRFDGNHLESLAGIHWVLPNDPLHCLPLEIFTRQYYAPSLLSQLLGRNSNSLAAVPPLGTLNHAQPKVRVVKVTPQDGSLSRVTVTVGVSEGGDVDATSHGSRSGIYDLRLFRDSQLVAQCPDSSSLDNLVNASYGTPAWDEEIQAWRRATSLLSGDRSNDTATIIFTNIMIPQAFVTKESSFTAYAFNCDRVRSAISDPVEYPISLTTNPATRHAYVIAMAVGANESDLDLDFAVRSADDLLHALNDKLSKNYAVVDVKLYSALNPNGPDVILKTATKENLHIIFRVLSGEHLTPSLLHAIDGAERLHQATPDDLVIFYVVSHGYASSTGTFYLVPYDTGADAAVTEATLNRYFLHSQTANDPAYERKFLDHCISSKDLTAWCKPIDAGETIMIFDACHSAALPGLEFRPGPLGDPGIGQLCYDKKIRLFCATQPNTLARATQLYRADRTVLSDVLIRTLSDNPALTLDTNLRLVEEDVPARFEYFYPFAPKADNQVPTFYDFGE